MAFGTQILECVCRYPLFGSRVLRILEGVLWKPGTPVFFVVPLKPDLKLSGNVATCFLKPGPGIVAWPREMFLEALSWNLNRVSRELVFRAASWKCMKMLSFEPFRSFSCKSCL